MVDKEQTELADDRLCPHCRRMMRPVTIVYGLPTSETAERAGAGEFVVGGCVVPSDSPAFACPLCREPLG